MLLYDSGPSDVMRGCVFPFTVVFSSASQVLFLKTAYLKSSLLLFLLMLFNVGLFLRVYLNF